MGFRRVQRAAIEVDDLGKQFLCQILGFRVIAHPPQKIGEQHGTLSPTQIALVLSGLHGAAACQGRGQGYADSWPCLYRRSSACESSEERRVGKGCVRRWIYRCALAP